LREEYRLRVFANRVLRRIFGSKRDEVFGEWRKLNNEKLNDLYCSPYIRVIKSRMRWVGHVTCVGRGEVLTGFWWREGKRPLERPRSRWSDSIKRRSSVSGMTGMDWIDLAQDRDRWRALGNAVMNLRIS